MSYAEKFLNARGQSCTIQRTPVVISKVSIKRSTTSTRNLAAREAYFEGLILANTGLKSGELVSVGSDNYLVQTVYSDPASGEDVFFAAKTNAILTHLQEVENVDDNKNILVSWSAVNTSVYAYGEIVTSKLRQEEPGLLDTAKYLFQVPKAISAAALDRIVYNNKKYKIESIDDIGLEGISRLQLSSDLR